MLFAQDDSCTDISRHRQRRAYVLVRQGEVQYFALHQPFVQILLQSKIIFRLLVVGPLLNLNAK